MSNIEKQAYDQWAEFIRLGNEKPKIAIMGKRTVDEMLNYCHQNNSSLLHQSMQGEDNLYFNGVRVVVSNRLDEISFF